MSVSAEYISKEIVRCLTLAEGGIHAVLLVLSARTRITQEEENTLRTLQALFGSQILDYVVVVFTGGDVLEECKETLEDYLGRDCPTFIKVGTLDIMIFKIPNFSYMILKNICILEVVTRCVDYIFAQNN